VLYVRESNKSGCRKVCEVNSSKSYLNFVLYPKLTVYVCGKGGVAINIELLAAQYFFFSSISLEDGTRTCSLYYCATVILLPDAVVIPFIFG
jgi:hypothetical protein